MIGSSHFRSLALFFAVLWGSGCTVEIEDAGDSDVQGAVEAMLAESAGAWNRGELAGFMDDYLKSESTTYIGEQGLLTRLRRHLGPLRPALRTGSGSRQSSVRGRKRTASGRDRCHRHGTVGAL